jgi:hypothetical protein
MTLV